MIWRIRHRRTFDELRFRGTRVRSGPIRLTYVPIETAGPQVAFAFGRRFGSAVERNRARRRLRAAFSEAWRDADPLGAYLLGGNRSVLTVPFTQLVGLLRRALADIRPTEPEPARLAAR